MTLFRSSLDENVQRETDFNALFNWVNGWSEVLLVVVTGPGVEVAVAHLMEAVPTLAVQVVTPGVTGTGTVYPGASAWTTSTVYLTATAAGTYAVILRRQ